MKLEGSCHCKKIAFSVNSPHPYPFNRCYCSICRKTAGGGGYAINLGADFGTLEVSGRTHLRRYHARMVDDATGEVSESPAERVFCGNCGSALWLWDPRWPELVHPHASAIDTDLPVPPEHVHMMLASRASWVEPCLGARDRQFDEYPDESVAGWHARLGLTR